MAYAKMLAYQQIRGYWISRYLDEAHSGSIQDILVRKKGWQHIEKMLTSKLSIKRRNLWPDIDGIVVEHFCSR